MFNNTQIVVLIVYIYDCIYIYVNIKKRTLVRYTNMYKL